MTARIRTLIATIFFMVMAAATFQAARSFATALERPELYDYFDDALSDVRETLTAVTWTKSDVLLDRPFEARDASSVAIRLTEAWSAHAEALASGITAYLPDQFSGSALKRATLSAANRNARMIVLHQTAWPTFFHSDGSFLQVASDTFTVRFLLNEDKLGVYRLAEDNTITTLLKNSTGWRVFSHERRAAKGLTIFRSKIEPESLRGFNYYPSEYPWSRFWPAFDQKVIRRDFSVMRGLGGNAVRVFLHQKAFLYPADATRDIANLKALLEEADAAGLRVVPTLFDMRGGFEPADWANDYLWLQSVLPVLASAPNVAFVDLKNEPNLDYKAHGEGLVQAWLRTMAAASRQIAPDLALTIGWSNAAAAGDLVDVVDVVTYHDFLAPETSSERLAKVRAVAESKPVYVTEIGASSWSIFLGQPHSLANQARVLQARLNGAADADGVFVWTLHDFPKPDPAAVGSSPWRLGLQSAFGLIAFDGTEKPAANVVRAVFQNYSRNKSQ